MKLYFQQIFALAIFFAVGSAEAESNGSKSTKVNDTGTHTSKPGMPPNVFLLLGKTLIARFLPGMDFPFLTNDSCDLITMKNGDEISVKVIQVNEKEISYLRCEDSTRYLYSIARSRVFMIKYADGTKEIMTLPPAEAPGKGKQPHPPRDTVHASIKKYNVTAIGYQIGGFTLVGFEYEIRLHDYVGLNFGAGFKGFTGGLKVHTGRKKYSPFFLIGYKDGGFGLISTLGAEFGGAIRFSRYSEVGLILQLGLAKILQIDSGFAGALYNGQSAPDVTLTAGIGICW